MKDAPTTPYLIRAIWEWCVDNGFTPYVAVKVDSATRVPMEYVRNGEIVLNISPDATRNLKIGNELIQFSARFNGVSREVSVPVAAVAGIFAKENGQGLAFQTAGAERSTPTLVPATGNDANGDKPKPPGGGKPRLQIVK
ncbi:MAG TPA: ClpXP protease specificity-enhancing factor [Burkholderiales bacterium]